MKSVIPVDLPEGQMGQQAVEVDKLFKRAELLGATKTGTWCVNCESYQAVANFSKSEIIIWIHQIYEIITETFY